MCPCDEAVDIVDVEGRGGGGASCSLKQQPLCRGVMSCHLVSCGCHLVTHVCTHYTDSCKCCGCSMSLPCRHPALTQVWILSHGLKSGPIDRYFCTLFPKVHIYVSIILKYILQTQNWFHTNICGIPCCTAITHQVFEIRGVHHLNLYLHCENLCISARWHFDG